MLTIPGQGSRYCDGFSRRSFLQIGGLAMGGISLSQVLRAEAAAGIRSSNKSVIMILLPGGPPHLDMFDMKPEAPSEIRGEFKPIGTNVSGIEICELMPRMATIMDRLAVVRSLHGGRNDHNVHQCLTGWESHPQQGDSGMVPGFPAGGWPSLGAAASHLLGPRDPAFPAFVSLAPPNAESTTRASLNQPGCLGMRHAGFEPLRRKRDNVRYRSGVSQQQVAQDQESGSDMVLQQISLERLSDRKRLLSSLDRLRRDVDASGQMADMDAITQQALGILTSSKLAHALDVSGEDLNVRRRYGIPEATLPVNGGPELLKQFLVARRLVEAGVRCVTLAFSRWPLERESRGGHNWDWHKDNFRKSRITLPMLDMGVTALMEDLSARNMLDDVSVVMWGEFGRSPRINGNAGRDHWPSANSAILAGGGMRTGQVIGSTNRLGEHPEDRPVHYREVFATLYHNLGINASNTHITDRGGRPHRLVDGWEPLSELV